MFKIPESLAKLTLERIAGQSVEGYIYGEGPRNPLVMLIGEAPGEQEIIDGIPFIGRSGKELMQSLNSIGLSREDVYISSAVRSRPYKWGKKKVRDGTITERKYNRPPTAKEILAHAPVLDYELKHLNPTLVVTLGNVGIQRLLGKEAKVTELHGRLIKSRVNCLNSLDDTTYSLTERVYNIVPTFHPASVFYRPSHRKTIEQDWQEIKNILRNI